MGDHFLLQGGESSQPMNQTCISCIAGRFFTTESSGNQRRQWQPTPVLLPRKSHGQRNLVGCRPWGCYEWDTTERLHFHCHALEKQMASNSSVLAWRISGTGEPGGLLGMGSHSWTRLKQLSCSSSIRECPKMSTL